VNDYVIFKLPGGTIGVGHLLIYVHLLCTRNFKAIDLSVLTLTGCCSLVVGCDPVMKQAVVIVVFDCCELYCLAVFSLSANVQPPLLTVTLFLPRHTLVFMVVLLCLLETIYYNYSVSCSLPFCG